MLKSLVRLGTGVLFAWVLCLSEPASAQPAGSGRTADAAAASLLHALRDIGTASDFLFTNAQLRDAVLEPSYCLQEVTLLELLNAALTLKACRREVFKVLARPVSSGLFTNIMVVRKNQIWKGASFGRFQTVADVENRIAEDRQKADGIPGRYYVLEAPGLDLSILAVWRENRVVYFPLRADPALGLNLRRKLNPRELQRKLRELQAR